MPNASVSIIRKPGQGRAIALAGDVNRFVATRQETGGAFAQWEVIIPPGGGPVPHLHTREIEAFFVIAGTVTFLIGDQHVEAPAGTFALAPIGVRHSFRNKSQEVARILITVTPAGLEDFFFEAGVDVPANCETTQATTHEEVQRILAVAPRYGIEIFVPGHEGKIE